MGVLDRFIGKGRSRGFPRNATFRVTEQGRERLQEFSGDLKGRVIMVLETRGTSSAGEIAMAAKPPMTRGQVERIMPALVDRGDVQLANPGGMGSSIEEGEDGD